MEEKLLIKKKCLCGCPVICNREKMKGSKPICGTCRKYGLEFAKQQWQKLHEESESKTQQNKSLDDFR